MIHTKGVSLCQQPEEKKKKKDRDRDFEVEPDLDEFHPSVKMDMEQQGDRPVRACRTQQGRNFHHFYYMYFVIPVKIQIKTSVFYAFLN